MANLSSVIKATSSLVKFSKTNVGKPKDAGKKSSAIVLSPQSAGTNQQRGSGLVKRDSFLIVKKSNQKSFSKFANVSLEENVEQIKVKVIQIDSLLKGSVALQQRSNKIRQKNIENKRRKRKEDELEKPKIPKNDKDLKKMPSIPGMGFLEGIMRFFLNMFLGWFAIKFLEYLPALIAIIKPLGYAVDGIMNFAGNLLNGLLTFVDWGYKAYQFTRDAIKNFAGENALNTFDRFTKALDTFMNLAIIAGMLSTLGGGGGPKSKGGSPTRPRPGQGGRPKVTRSGGKPQGRPDFRNPFRERPTVTTGGGRGFRNPFRQGPRVTTGGGGAPRFFNPKGFLTGAKTFGVGLLLDYAMNEFVTKPMEEAVVNRGVSKISSLPPEERRKKIELILAEIKKEKDWQSGGGGIFDKTLKLGGLLGETSSEIKVRQLEETLARLKSAGYNGGGLVGYAQGGGVITRAGQFVGGITRGLGDVIKRLSFTLPSIPNIEPGSKIGGDQQLEKVFPNPNSPKSKISPIKYLSDTSNIFAETDYLGPLFSIVTKSILGSKITNEDYRNIGLGINSWIASGINEKKIKGGLSPAFAEGGIVESVPVAEDISKWAEQSSKELIASKVAESNRELLRNILLHDHDHEMIQQKKDEVIPPLDVGPGDGTEPTVTGGNADFWTLVAISRMEDADPQGSADVAQSIYNRVASGIYGGKTIKEIVLRQGQYEPTWKYPKRGKTKVPNAEWHAIKDLASASAATGISQGDLQKTAAAIRNPTLQEEARKFVGGRTDFMGGGNRKGAEDVQRTTNAPNNFFGWFVGPAAKAYGAKNPGPARAPQLGDIVVMGDGAGGPLGTGSISNVDQFTPLAKKFGLTLTSSYRPGDPGYHGKNRARDYSNDAVGNGTPQQLAFAKELASKYGSSLSQLIYTPLGYGIANKKKVGLDYWGPGTNAQHYHHVHVAYERGGLTKAGPHLAKIGEKGREFVIDADSTAAIEKTFPGFLNAVNKGNYEGSIRALRTFASYETEAVQTVYIPTPVPYYTDMPAGSDGNPTNMGAASSFHDSYEILERLPG